jgi:uncharacterized membrane protein
LADSGTLSTVASITSGFGVAMLFFRIQRELQMGERDEIVWIPQADWLLIAATLVSLLLVILPLVSLDLRNTSLINLPAAACSASSMLLAGYILSILAHYRLLFGRKRSGPRENPEPAERILVWITIVLAAVIFIAVLIMSKATAT